MRILIVNSFRRILGGVETYLRGVLPALAARGHVLAFAWEHDEPAAHPVILEDAEHVALSGRPPGSALAELRRWRPDLVFLHGISDPGLVEALRCLAPIVYVAHDYRGGCISGLKTWSSVPTPCSRPLGPACLLHYYPHRCGGLDPRTMWRDWRRQRRLQGALRRHEALVVASAHMRAEMLRQGAKPARVHRLDFYAPGVERACASGAPRPRPRALAREARLLVAGRLDRLKGVHLAIDALPAVAERLGRPARLVVAGDGPERASLEAHARRTGASVEFTGWSDAGTLDRQVEAAELLVVPSIWPEPFGLVGPEAGIRGVPAAAFGVGGIPSWLEHDENGRLAPGDRPEASTLAEAIAGCLADEATWNRLREGAWQRAARHRLDPHVAQLERIFDATVIEGRSPSREHGEGAEAAGWHETGL